MPCQHVKLPTGETAIVCGGSVKRCSFPGCKNPGIRLCDWKVTDRKSGTCDVAMCAFHAFSPKGYDDKDLCPEHKAAWMEMLRAKGVKP